ncbi:MAG: hypothetical protein SFU99_07925 [Saprospiraceae bacterium]|nr:hypothetical protein [Saprospiraceae bacterium]
MRTFLVIFSILLPFILLGQHCPYATDPITKANKIYLYFLPPGQTDNGFREFGSDYSLSTNPLMGFNINTLFTPGPSDDLRESIRILVADHYCEFDVGVLETVTAPAISTAANARTNIIGIATDNENNADEIIYGAAEGTNFEDNTVGYARIWVGEFKNQFGMSGGALNSSHSDILNRWANAIASTASHEAGHNYQLGHETLASSNSQEDAITNHIMTEGNLLDGNNRATVPKHFGNANFEALAHSLGLNVNTLHSWDLINPNSQVATQMVITVFSKATSLSIVNADVSRCPWQAPTLTQISPSSQFRLLDDYYYKFELNFNQAKSWVGGNAGQVPGGGRFHVGVAFATNEAVIVTDVKLKNGSTYLPLYPRTVGFDKGFIDIATGQANITMLNTGLDTSRVSERSTPTALRIENLSIDFLPRVADLKSMQNFDGRIFPTPNQEGLYDFRGLKVNSHGMMDQRPNFVLQTVEKIFFGKLTDGRHINITYDSTNCIPGIIPGDVHKGKINYCPHGTLLSLFPSTMIYVTATIVDPNATYFDPNRNEFVTGELRTYVQYQFSGIKPDFNKNGIDDLIDIKNGTSKDTDGNGIPDEVVQEFTDKKDSPPRPAWWSWGIIILLILIIIFIMVNRNRRTDIG